MSQNLFKEANNKLLQEFHELDMKMNEKWGNYIKYMETGDKGYLKKQTEVLQATDPSKCLKENIEPNSSNLPRKTTRQNSSANTDNCLPLPTLKIKMEKLSIAQPASVPSDANETRNDDMPAPTMLPPKKKKIKEECSEPVKRSTRTKTRRNCQEELEVNVDRGKPSDVIVQNTTITTIDITDDNEKTKEKAGVTEQLIINESTRSTRTKTRQQKKKAEENEEAKNKDNQNVSLNKTKIKHQNKRSKLIEETEITNSPSDDKEENKSAQTEYEDAVSILECNNEERADIQSTTMVIVPAFNSTVVVENPKVVQNNAQTNESDLKTPPKTKSKKEQIKEIFSPYDKTSMKKKVEAFEKLGSASKALRSVSKIPVAEEIGSDARTKNCTPFANKFLPNSCSTSKINRMTPTSQSSNDNCLPMKTLSALKASHAEYKEREKRRQEKEQEALLKKEAMLQAQADEKRRKREEKQLKAQQQREMLQKEKEKLLEMHKLKQEKHKQAIAEKEEKLQKAKEEVEKKRLLAKNKAKLTKTESSDGKVGESVLSKKTQVLDKQPKYLVTKPPLLPTDDCYDSDDEQPTKSLRVKPQWSRDDYLKRQLYTQLVAGEKIKNSLFCCQTRSPDLVEIFEYIDPQKLKRTSSAVWKAPPRYTLFSMTNDIQFSEDSD